MIWKVLLSMVLGAITFALGGISFAQSASFNYAGCTPKKFKVTAYYSPWPGQAFYYKGNERDEKILNGNGTHGASGEPVHNGMVAAPPSYAFGTQIYLPGRGIGDVTDRGGAIQEQGARPDATFDRIDVRAGEGEAGLERALSFGVQYIDGYICEPGTFEKAGFDYAAFPEYDHFFHASLWIIPLGPGRQDPWVKALQEYLIAMNYMAPGRNTGYYGKETKAAVCLYQQKHLGLAASSEWCGYFGRQTASSLRQKVKELGLTAEFVQTNGFAEHDHSDEGLAVAESEPVKLATTTTPEEIVDVDTESTPLVEPDVLDARIIEYLFTKGEFQNYKFTDPIKKGDQGKVVRILFRKLQYLGYLAPEMTVSDIYNLTMIQAVYAFQLDNKVLHGTEDPGLRGYFGPNTREVMNSK